MNYKIYNIIGEAKSGTTLVGTLLDSHPNITTIPIELKFVSHFINKSHLDDKNLIKYFLNRTRLKNLEYSQKSKKKREFKIINGIYKPIKFDFNKFQELVLNNKIKKYSKQRLINLIIHIHKYFELSQNKDLKSIIIIQDGNHAIKNIDKIEKKFPKIRNIVITRNPLDVYTSLKKINKITKNYYFLIKKINKINIDISKITNLIKKNDKNNFFIKYEELVTNPKFILLELCEYLNIKFTKSLLRPTFMNSDWYGNSSTEKKIYGIKDSRIDIYRKELKKFEVKYLTYKFRYLLEYYYGYKNIRKYQINDLIYITGYNIFLFISNCNKDIKFPIKFLKFIYKLIIN